jgi:glycosyltransferase involved in cell wall biosynthesis
MAVPMPAPSEPNRPPEISVIVPVWNVADCVAACIASLRAQDFADFEAIVVDDGSTDDSRAIARAAIGNDPRFTLLTQPNRGLSGARNTGLAQAQGNWIAFLDSDDRVAPGWLARLHAAVLAHDAAWAACGIRFVYPDGRTADHSAIHGAPDLAACPGTRRMPLADWREVIPHFPSAWNKLYRRALIAGLTFDEGTWFEDHSFFWRAAARTDHIVHLPEPLYLHSRARAGQITASASERVFEQFDVLDRLNGIARAAAKPGGRAAFSRIATRLLSERSDALPAGALRERYAAACRAWLARNDLVYDPDWDRHIGRVWGLTLAGALALSIVIPFRGDAGPLSVTLRALDGPDTADAEILVVCDAGDAGSAAVARAAIGDRKRARLLVQTECGAAAARNAGGAAAQGRVVLFLDAGDIPMPEGVGRWADAILRERADFGVGAFRMGGRDGPVHAGFMDAGTLGLDALIDAPGALTPAQALQAHGPPSARMFRRDFLQAHGLRFAEGLRPDWPLMLRAGLLSRRTLYLALPGVAESHDPAARRLMRRWPRPAEIAAQLDAIAALPEAARLSQGWRRRLYARIVADALHEARPAHRFARTAFTLRAALAARRLGLARARGDLDAATTGRRLAWIMGGGARPAAMPGPEAGGR